MSSNAEHTNASENHPDGKDNVNAATDEENRLAALRDIEDDITKMEETYGRHPTEAERTDRSSTPPPLDPDSPVAMSPYPADDARSMSPRRSDEEMQAMSDRIRARLQDQALQHQAELRQIAEDLEVVRRESERLERENLALQEYIGALTRSLSASTTGAKGKGKK